jgi:hypothetical protein
MIGFSFDIKILNDNIIEFIILKNYYLYLLLYFF